MVIFLDGMQVFSPPRTGRGKKPVMLLDSGLMRVLSGSCGTHGYIPRGTRPSPMHLLFGIGNPLLGDDGAGNHVARRLAADGWLAFDCGTAPENFTSVVRRERPDLLVIVDAVDMALPAGAVRIVPSDRIEDCGIGTHSLPLTALISFIGDAAGEVIVVGIQPSILDLGEGLSPAVRDGANGLVARIAAGRVREVPVLEGGGRPFS